MGRLRLIKLHMLLAAFVLPAALMFVVTGAFYTWGIKGDYVSTTEQIPLTAPLEADAGALQALAAKALEARALALPTGTGEVKTGGTSWKFEWTGANRDVTLEPTADPQVALLAIKDTTWYRNLVQLHKAKGGTAFKAYAGLLAAALIVILLSGLLMALQAPGLRHQAVGAMLTGFLLFFVMIGVS